MWLKSLQRELFGRENLSLVLSYHLPVDAALLCPARCSFFVHQAANRRPEQNDPTQQSLLPGVASDLPEIPTLVLDLDETLIHTVTDPVSNVSTTHSRPGLRYFLRSVASRFEVVIFTAGLEEHASPLIDALDADGVVRHRLFRQHTRSIGDKLIKDLATLNRPLSRTVIVDNRWEDPALYGNVAPAHSRPGCLARSLAPGTRATLRPSSTCKPKHMDALKCVHASLHKHVLIILDMW